MAMISSSRGARKEPGRHTQLTPRQAELVELAADGMSAKQIARYLGISKPTVDGHFKAARDRTGASNMAELIGKTRVIKSGGQGRCLDASTCSEISDFPDSSHRERRRGRPTVMTPDRLDAARELLRTCPVTQVARKLGIGRTTLYAYREAINNSELPFPWNTSPDRRGIARAIAQLLTGYRSRRQTRGGKAFI